WDWCGKVQERGAARSSLSYRMRLALGVPVGMIVVGLVVPSALAAQAALTPADSAILASQPLKRLVIAPSLLRRISLLAAGLDPVRHRERGPRPRPDRVLVATGAGGGKPPREVPAALPAAVAGAADSGGRRSGPEAARAFRPLAVIDEDVALDLGRREWSAAEAATRRLPLKRQIDARLRAGAEPRVDSRTPSDLTL